MFHKMKEHRDAVLTDPFFGDAVKFALGKSSSLKNKIILDSGCGPGDLSICFALDGANVIGIDKRKTAITEARNQAQTFGVIENCTFLKGYAENLPLCSESIDMVWSRSAIQYMDRSKVLGEYLRILKPNGVIVLIENLRYNPFINLYRLYRSLFSRTPQQKAYKNSIRGYFTIKEVEDFSKHLRVSSNLCK